MHRRFTEARSARLATVDAGGRPHLVPVCFFATHEKLITAVDHKPKSTQRLKRLENVCAAPAVSLVVDHYEEDWSRLWWVRVDGAARVVDDGAEVEDLFGPLLAKYPEQYGPQPPRGPAIIVELQQWTSWAASP